MNKKLPLKLLIILVGLFYFSLNTSAQIGDTITINNKKLRILSNNLIPNPGFENGFTDWTDATTSAATLSSTRFTIVPNGGVDNTSYLVGLNSGGATSSSSIGTGWSIEPSKSYLFSFQIKYLDDTRAEGTADYVKTSLTNNKTSSSEPQVLINGAKVNGGGAWTQNYIFFTNSDPAYNSIMARFRWLSNLFGFDDFILYEVEEVINYDDLRTTINEAEAIYNSEANQAAALLTAIENAKTYLTSTSIDDLKQAVSDLQNAIKVYNYANASEENPANFTDFIENPSFESSLEGWTNKGMSTQNNSFFPNKEGSIYIEKWVSRGNKIPDVSIEQSINELPNGFYTLTATGGNIQQSGSGSILNNTTEPQTGAYIFAGNTKVVVDTIKDRSIKFFVTNKSITIGLKTENATGNWLSCDNFRLTYRGFDIESAKTYIQELVNAANVLLTDKMKDEVRTELTNSINSGNIIIADQNPSQESLASTIQQLKDKTLDASVSLNSYKNLQTGIDFALNTYGDGTGNEANTLEIAIDDATEISNNFSVSLDDIYNATEELSKAVFNYGLANPTGAAPIVVTNTNYARGATMALARSTISGVDLSNIREHGICWSTQSEPTIFDDKTTKFFVSNGNIYHLQNLEPSTTYYMRAYAISSGNAVGYGAEIKFITIPKGEVTYNLTSGLTGENRIRVEAAMNSAVNYYNNLTSIKEHHLTVNYGSGTPTAEASYGGWMRFGPKESYQRTGTALHEIAHTIGVGTHSMWSGPNSPLRETGSRGAWLGDRVDKVVQFITNNPDEYLRGDHVHMWPYGINGAHEDSGSELLYISNCLIAQALGEDGLPPSGGFATPAYTFEVKDNTKYYIKSESDETGRDNSFIAINESGNLVNTIMTAFEAMNNDSAAWYINFNPLNSYYTIKNVATNRYFTFKNTGDNGITTTDRQTPNSDDYFQLMKARIETTIASQSETYKGFWIIHPEDNNSPASLTATTTGLTTTNAFDIKDSAKSQRWLLLDFEEVQTINSILNTDSNEIDKNSSNPFAYSENNLLHIKNINSKTDVSIYDIRGTLILKANNISSSFSHTMKKGIYIIMLKSEANNEVKKVIVH